MIPVTSPDQRVRAPARRFSEDRLKDPPTGKDPETAAARLATPWLTNSLLALHRWPSSSANTLAMDAGSAKPTRAMRIPPTSSEPVDPQGRSSERAGRPVGTSPTTGPA